LEITKIYQTLEERGNPDDIESYRPFICRSKTAWLAHDYYFWDSFIENAHWWGTKIDTDEYVICEAEASFNPQIVMI